MTKLAIPAPAGRRRGAYDDETTRPGVDDPPPPPTSAYTLTIAYHPDLRRIGDIAHLRELDEGRTCELARSWPDFHSVDGRWTGPLADRCVSRAPLLLLADKTGNVTIRDPHAAALVNGRRLTAPLQVTAHELAAGVLLLLGGNVLLLLHPQEQLERPSPPKYNLVGESSALLRVRADIMDVAGSSLPVLLRGESGTGKEMVARALHTASPRAARPCVSINLAALNPQTAVAELFGHSRGAFTGAVQARDGYFRDAHTGTLFLDEIGEASPEVQVMLLRALETGEIQPIGGGQSRQVDVRLIAATDTNLEEAALRGDFRVSLLHRIAGYEIWLPPLRKRRDDIPRLFMHFARNELLRRGLGESDEALVRRVGARLPASLMQRMLAHAWPGNVRQLNNVVRQFVALALGGRSPAGSAALARLLVAGDDEISSDEISSDEIADDEIVDDEVTAAEHPRPRSPLARGLAHISDEVLVEALRRNGWRIDATAADLRISKTSLYVLIERCPRVRKARDLTRDELAAAETRHAGDHRRMSEELRVSLRGLKLRLRELGLAR